MTRYARFSSIQVYSLPLNQVYIAPSYATKGKYHVIHNESSYIILMNGQSRAPEDAQGEIA
jgi:hypothetical protein